MNSPDDTATPSAGPGAEAPDDADPQSAVAEFRDRWMRAEAEIANVRSRAKRDVDDARQYAVQKFATDVVEGVENLHRGLESLPQSRTGEPDLLSSLRTGFEGIERNFLSVLERHGVRREDVAVGAAFDPERQQAMSEQDSTTAAPGTILHVLTAGWALNGRLLRPAMVIVAKPSQPGTDRSHRMSSA